MHILKKVGKKSLLAIVALNVSVITALAACGQYTQGSSGADIDTSGCPGSCTRTPWTYYDCYGGQGSCSPYKDYGSTTSGTCTSVTGSGGVTFYTCE